MTFDAREKSLSGGQPLRLYEFQRGLQRWRYVRGDRPFVLLSDTFEPIAITDDGIRQTGDASADALKITVPYDNPVARLYRGIPPAGVVDVIVRDAHYGKTQAAIRFMGSVQSVKGPSPERKEITCQSLAASLDNPGLRIGYERGCPYSLFDHNCTLDPTPFAVAATLSLVTGLSVEAAAFDAHPDGYFSGGRLKWQVAAGVFDERGIESHVGEVLTLLGGTDGLQVGRSVTAYPGDDRTLQMCHERFNNKDNYGGFKHMPGKSPFDGNPVF